MRIVLDTNVVLSALLWQGNPHQLLTAIRIRPDVALYSSPVVLEELADVLSRRSPAQRLALIGKSASDILTDYVAAINMVEPAIVPRVVPGDADDDHVIAAAVAARADLIVTEDRKHMLPIGNHAGIAIVSVMGAVRRLRAL